MPGSNKARSHFDLILKGEPHMSTNAPDEKGPAGLDDNDDDGDDTGGGDEDASWTSGGGN